MFTYDFKFDWTLHGKVGGDSPIVSDDAYKGDVINGLNKVAAQKFAEKMAPTGHLYRVNSTNTTCKITNKQLRYVADYPLYEYTFTGTTTLNFDTDVKDPKAHNSPQLEEVLIAILGAILTMIVTYPLVVLLIVGFIAFVIGASVLINTGTNAINTLGSTPGSFAIVAGILVVTGLGIVALFFTSGGRKVTHKAAGLGRRAYRSVARRRR